MGNGQEMTWSCWGMRQLAGLWVVIGIFMSGSGLAEMDGYVGSEACVGCHAEIAQSYQVSEMGRSFYEPAGMAPIETFPVKVTDEKSGLHYAQVKRGNDLYQREWREDAAGDVTHELEHRVDYVVGSGSHNRTYLSQRDGVLYELPLTWYTDSGVWDLSPGYDEENLRFSRPIVPECMNCHNSYTEHAPFTQGRFGDIPHGIGCERCHGAGETHVALYNDGAEVADTIVNPAKLEGGRGLQVCLQCHLQGSISVVKAGMDETSFRPGMAVSEVRSIYGVAKADDSGDFGIASHGERMMKSRCFTASDGAMTCVTCHDPHKPLKETAWASYNQACLGCHSDAELSGGQAGHTAAGDCASCHMRQGETSNIIHVNFTDHWIRTVSDSGAVSFEEAKERSRGKVVELEPFFEETDSAAGIREGIAYVKYYEAKHAHPTYLREAIGLLEAGLAQVPDHHEGRFHLGIALRHVRREADAIVQLKKAADLEPRDGRPHFLMGRIYQTLGKHDEALAAYQASLRVMPANAVAYNNLGNVYAAKRETKRAVAAYQETIRVRSDYAPALNNLGDQYAFQMGDVASGRAFFEAALKHEPDFVVAIHNLGTVLLAEGEKEAGRERFLRALALDAGFVPAMGNLVEMYIEEGNGREAREMIGRMEEVLPGDERVGEMRRRAMKIEY